MSLRAEGMAILLTVFPFLSLRAEGVAILPTENNISLRNNETERLLKSFF